MYHSPWTGQSLPYLLNKRVILDIKPNESLEISCPKKYNLEKAGDQKLMIFSCFLGP